MKTSKLQEKPSKKNIHQFKNFLDFFYICGRVFFTLLDPDPAAQLSSDPDLQQCQKLRILARFILSCLSKSTAFTL